MSGVPTAVLAFRWPLHREGLRRVVEGVIDVVGTAGAVDDALELVGETLPSLVVIESGLPGKGVELCSSIKQNDALAAARVLVVGTSSREADLVEAVHSGADGFVSESDGVDSLVDALRRLGRGEATIPGEMLGGLLRALIRDRREEDEALERFSRLSRREREILALLVEGLGNATIAERLIMSPNTVRTHVQNILRKLEVSSRLEAATLAMSHELLERFPVNEDARKDQS